MNGQEGRGRALQVPEAGPEAVQIQFVKDLAVLLAMATTLMSG